VDGVGHVVGARRPVQVEVERHVDEELLTLLALDVVQAVVAAYP
jgi:hypothetical protein